MPALNEAINSIEAIPRQDISEIKVMKTPPRVIKLIMKALCILLGI
jgi:dynein heavy chain